MHWFVDKVKEFYPETKIEPLAAPGQVVKYAGDPLSTFLSVIEHGGILTFDDVPQRDFGIDTGFVLSTSGTTGEPKQALYSFDKFLLKFAEATPKPIKTVMVMGLDHIGGLDVYFSVISRGGQVFFPEQVTVDAVCELIQREKIEFISVPPTFLNLILISGANAFYDLTSLRTINFGSEPMRPTLLEHLQDVFPDVKFKQTFGTTETGTLKVECMPHKPMFIKIPDSKVIDGKLYVKSNYGMLGYLDEPSPFEDGYFPTGDMVAEWGDYVRILGRASDAVNVGGVKVSPTKVEEMISYISGVEDVVVYGEKNLITGNILVAEIVWKGEGNCAEIVKNDMRSWVGKYEIPSKIKVVPEIVISGRMKKIRTGKTC